MSFDRLVYAQELRENWQEQYFARLGKVVALRVHCMTCRCYTIPARVIHNEATRLCSVKTPSEYPCPVCGQHDQYKPVMIKRRMMNYVAAHEKLATQGFVSKDFGELRAPTRFELPDLETDAGFRDGRALFVPTELKLTPDVKAIDCLKCSQLIRRIPKELCEG